MLGEYNWLEAGGFLAVVAVSLWIDLRAHRNDEPVSSKNAMLWSALWIGLSFAFAAYVGIRHGAQDGALFITAYLVEKSLSVDNLFVIMAVFSSFAIKDALQHRVLYFGVIGALVMRFVFIGLGTGMVMQFGKYALGVFALIIIWSAWKMWRNRMSSQNEIVDYSNHWSIRLTKKFFPIHPFLAGHKFFVKERGIRMITPLFLCLICVETADIIFAADSVPAVISVVGANLFLVYTSNVFAVLGLRSLYFLLAAGKRRLSRLEQAVIAVLLFIGVKMLLDVSGLIHINPYISLAAVLLLLSAGVVFSFLYPVRNES
ncbi:MAG: TerC/Alx family metal homeostasis membrane protein [Desulfarculales bacterium]|jgi:tellurite resistance protein TerC|nr:TerC/Alx family metal homeostasis membrane protein [Desulfarculales bacterium]